MKKINVAKVIMGVGGVLLAAGGAAIGIKKFGDRKALTSNADGCCDDATDEADDEETVEAESVSEQ